MMNGQEKSDSAIVAVKSPNKAGSPVAEAMEPRAGTKGNAEQQSTDRTQTRARVTHALSAHGNSPSHTQGRKRMLELGSSGSVRGCSATSIPAAILDPQHAFKDTWAESMRKIANAADFGGRRVCCEPAN